MTIDQIKALNESKGFHFFEPGAMRFFRSRILGRTFGRFFVTSERFVSPHGSRARAYTVRAISLDTGEIETIHGFQAYRSARAAYAAAKHANDNEGA